MNPIKKIINKLRLLLLHRALKKTTRKKRVVSYALAKRVAVLYESDCQGKPGYLKKLLLHLNNDNKKTATLAYYPHKKGQENLDKQLNETCFGNRDLTFLMKPKKESLKQFISQEFDILLDLTSHQAGRAKHIAAVSNALYKVGAFNKHYNQVYDLILHVKDDCPASELAEHAIHYLKIIKTKEEHDQ